MTKTTLCIIALALTTPAVFAGTEYSGKEYKQTTVAPQPQECWYGDNEWNVTLWGTYAFTGHDEVGIGAPDFFFRRSAGGDRYLESDHAWGGGGDIKYFMHKYFGIGLEGFALDAHRTEFDFEGLPIAGGRNKPGGFTFTKSEDDRAIGAVLGTFTLRYPIGCTRFAPYVWAGGGGIFGGGEQDNVFFNTATGIYNTHHRGSDGRGMGQFGGGIEVRITRHIGWMSDFSWNVVDGPNNNFGMVRTGLTFAF